MDHASEHSACVDAWMERTAAGLLSEPLLQAFEQAFGALWRRAHVTLGEVTLCAIVDRVLHNASERYPFLSWLRVESTGLRSEQLHEYAGRLTPDQLAEGIRFVLLEFITVLGNLTAEILTPALHAELSKVGREAMVPAEGAAASAPGTPEGDDREGADS
ncbi:MAG TPA: hypothetical protein VLS89_20245 [Candidatus Nanopelagicales bacterium]|nr:hypothetical protein [Candidatus Nanopelagicales bacterium]